MPYPESTHPYLDNLDETQVWVQPGAPANIWVTFDALTATEPGFDFIYLYDSLNNPVGNPAGYSSTQLAGVTIPVPGDTVKVRLVTDFALTFWGYKVTSVAAVSSLPVTPIDPVNLAMNGVNAYNYQSGTFLGPIEAGGALYVLLKPNLVASPDYALYTMYKSVDGGPTWVIVDSGNGMGRSGAWGFASAQQGIDYRGGNTIYLAQWYSTLPGLLPPFPYDNGVQFQTFSLATETFSAVARHIIAAWASIVAGPAYVGEIGTYRRMVSGNELISYWLQDQTTWPLVNSKHWGAWTGAAWALDAFPMIVQPIEFPKISLVDPDDKCHLFYYSEVDSSSWYTQLDELGGNTAPVSVGLFTRVYNGMVSGADLLFAAQTDTGGGSSGHPALLRVSPYNAAAPAITVTNLAAGYHSKGSYLLQSGGTLYYVFLAVVSPAVPADDALYYCESTDDGATWTAPTLIHSEKLNPTFPDELAQYMSGLSAALLSTGEIAVVVQLTHSGDALSSFLKYAVVAPPPPPPPPPVPIPSRDVYRIGKPYIKCGNVWDWCLKNSECPWYLVPWGEHGCIPVKCWRLEDDPLHSIPEQGRELHKWGSIPLPVVPNIDTQILQFRVPLGFDGIIYSVLCKFMGTGYVNGDGSLIWRFRQNERWIKSLHSIPTELGDFTSYMQLEEYIRVYSGQTVRAYGWVNVASGLVGGSMIAALQGWYFPSQFAR